VDLVKLYLGGCRPTADLYSLTNGERDMQVDALDARLIELLADQPRLGVLECSRRLGVARGTAQARLDRLQRDRVVIGFGPQLDPAALGFAVTAFVTLEIRQDRGHDAVARHLATIPEVLEAYTITGPADLFCRIVGRSNADLQRVIDQLVADDTIVRSSSVIALATQIPYRVIPLLRAAVAAPAPAPAPVITEDRATYRACCFLSGEHDRRGTS
jgi:DNA-binding Lrp family transcriptional regulator